MAVSLNITQEDIQYAKSFITQYLQDQIPEADFSDGTALQDLVVRSSAHMFAYLRAELKKVQTLRSLSQLQNLDEDDEVNQAVDDVISNFFINRGGGAKAKVGVTITLSQRADVFIGTPISFNRDGTHVFYPITEYTINKENLIEVISSTGVSVYEFDITLEAQDIGTEYEVPAGNFVSWDSFSPYVISVRNIAKATGGSSVESNASYINRSNDAITVRNLINPKSNRTVLMDNFASQGLKDVTTIGYGDPEMLRDSINTNVTWTTINTVHIGNHQDIYLNLPILERQTYQDLTETDVYLGEPDRPGSIKMPGVPVYKIHSVVDSTTLEALPYTIYVRDHRYTYTFYQQMYVILNSGQNGRDVTITYDTVSGFDLIHNYLIDPDERVTLANSLARAVIPIYLEVNFSYHQIKGQKDLDTDAAAQAVIDYVASLRSTDTVYVDSFVKAVHDKFGKIIIIQTPMTIKGTVYYPNGVAQVFYSDNVLTVPEYPAIGVTNRICGYFITKSYITFTRIS